MFVEHIYFCFLLIVLNKSLHIHLETHSYWTKWVAVVHPFVRHLAHIQNLRRRNYRNF